MRHRHKASKSFFRHVQRRPKTIRKAKITPETVSVGRSGEAAPVSHTASSLMTTAELISQAKRNIGSSETSLRAAAEDIARAYDQGATQREVAEGVGKSPAWVNRLLKWRSSGYEGTAFGGKFVQGVNKNALPPEPASTDPALAGATCTQPDAALAASIPHTNISSLEPVDIVLGENDSADSADREHLVEAVEALGSSEAQERVDTIPALAPTTKMLSAAPASGDFHLPAACNRQDPELAFQRLAEQWSPIPFRVLLLNSPKKAQERFLTDVLLPELGGLEAINLLVSTEQSGS